jgi:hypothetical protein
MIDRVGDLTYWRAVSVPIARAVMLSTASMPTYFAGARDLVAMLFERAEQEIRRARSAAEPAPYGWDEVAGAVRRACDRFAESFQLDKEKLASGEQVTTSTMFSKESADEWARGLAVAEAVEIAVRLAREQRVREGGPAGDILDINETAAALESGALPRSEAPHRASGGTQ